MKVFRAGKFLPFEYFHFVYSNTCYGWMNSAWICIGAVVREFIFLHKHWFDSARKWILSMRLVDFDFWEKVSKWILVWRAPVSGPIDAKTPIFVQHMHQAFRNYPSECLPYYSSGANSLNLLTMLLAFEWKIITSTEIASSLPNIGQLSTWSVLFA